jgi:hypothetical protein
MGGYITPTYTAIPFSNTMVGFRQEVTLSSTAVASGDKWVLIDSLQTFPNGTWLLIGTVTIPIITGTLFSLTIGCTNAPQAQLPIKSALASSTGSNVATTHLQISHTISAAGETSWGMFGKMYSGTQNITDCRIQLLRIA